MNRRKALKIISTVPLYFTFQVKAEAGVKLPEELNRFHWVLIPPSDPDYRKAGIRTILSEIERKTSVETSSKILYLKPGDPELYYRPFTSILGYSAFEMPDKNYISGLRTFLDMGGFLFIEDSSGIPGSPFFLSVEKLLRRIFPDKNIVELPEDHVIYRTFYLLKSASGRFHINSKLLGIVSGVRAPVVISLNDALGAVARDPETGEYIYPLPDNLRMEALKTLINVVMYSQTVNYKSDQIHIPFIIKRLKER